MPLSIQFCMDWDALAQLRACLRRSGVVLASGLWVRAKSLIPYTFGYQCTLTSPVLCNSEKTTSHRRSTNNFILQKASTPSNKLTVPATDSEDIA
jgi:hypothetical protein